MHLCLSCRHIRFTENYSNDWQLLLWQLYIECIWFRNWIAKSKLKFLSKSHLTYYPPFWYLVWYKLILLDFGSDLCESLYKPFKVTKKKNKKVIMSEIHCVLNKLEIRNESISTLICLTFLLFCHYLVSLEKVSCLLTNHHRLITIGSHSPQFVFQLSLSNRLQTSIRLSLLWFFQPRIDSLIKRENFSGFINRLPWGSVRSHGTTRTRAGLSLPSSGGRRSISQNAGRHLLQLVLPCCILGPVHHLVNICSLKRALKSLNLARPLRMAIWPSGHPSPFFRR